MDPGGRGGEKPGCRDAAGGGDRAGAVTCPRFLSSFLPSTDLPAKACAQVALLEQWVVASLLLARKLGTD